MCFKVECEKCEKPTWKGCGKHIEQALKDVPEDERCKCPRDTPAATTAVTVEKKTEESTVTATASEETKTADTEENKSANAEENKSADTAETKEKAD